mgnify:FL=1|jgi:type II restriction enzyme
MKKCKNNKNMRFTFENVKAIYEKMKNNAIEEDKGDAYKHISEILKEVKEDHRKYWEENKTPKKDHEQSWRAFKGKNFEKLVQYIIEEEIKNLGLKVINGNQLERRSENLSPELDRVKRNLLVDYGEFGSHLPDIDLVIYDPTDCKVIAVISSKITLRERITQTGYWKLKLSKGPNTKDIKVYFVTPDEDKTLKEKKPAKKGRAIVETDLDGTYVLTEEEIDESEKVKSFGHFIDDFKKLIKKQNNIYKY